MPHNPKECKSYAKLQNIYFLNPAPSKIGLDKALFPAVYYVGF